MILTAFPAAFLMACSGGEPQTETSAPVTAEIAADMSLPDMADRVIADSRELTTMLARVDSAEAAEAARPEVEAMVANYRVLIDRFETMGEPSFSDMAALASRGAALAEAQQGVSAEVRRIYNDHPEAADILRDALDDAGRAQP